MSKECNFLAGKGSCKSEHKCFINSKKHSNCWNCYKYFINGNPHTLHQCADLLGTSHTTVAQVEKVALEKLKEILSSIKK